MSTDVIWALDQRERCIACPSTPAANAVVLHLATDGSLARADVGTWAEQGVMAAGVAWPGTTGELSDDDWLDLEDAVTGLAGLAQCVAIHGDEGLDEVVTDLARRTQVTLVGIGDAEALRARVVAEAPA